MEKYLYTPKTGSYNFVMAYPAVEEFALASLGYLWLYKIANSIEGINATRISTDKIDINAKNIDSIAFSMSFDFDFMGVLEILDKLNMPLYSSERNSQHPLVFAGGPVITTNPKPYEAFFDFMIIGDGEEVFEKVLEILKNNDKETALKLLSNIDEIYFPNQKVKKTTVNLQNVIYTPIISDKSYFKETFIIEVARGCMNRCAFCTASYTNLPFRNYEYERIIETIDLGLKYTNKIALLGAQISAHPRFDDIMKYLRNKIESGIKIELGGQKTSTIAIEAASERLRKYINKNLKEEQILSAVKVARENGLKGLKIYSMIGIPSETKEDIEYFIELAKKIKTENKGFSIEFSFSTFVPKPQTPLQWARREETSSLEKKQKYLEKEFAKLGISSKFSSAKWDFWQTVLSRGDESLTPMLVEVYKRGGKLGAYKSVAKDLKIDLDKYTKELDINAELPWDIIENYPRKEILKNEKKRLERFL